MAAPAAKHIFDGGRTWKSCVACKVCAADSHIYGVVDFNKTCEEQHGKFLPLLGEPVYYYECTACRLVFTVDFDSWSKQQFKDEIYNDDYILCDPDYLASRPVANAKMIAEFIKGNRQVSVVDYGGGNGRLAAELKAQGFNAVSWDPMDDSAPKPVDAHFKLVTAFEVMEHTPTPVQTFAEMADLLEEDGVILFSTLAIDALSPRDVGHWYISPRNGHVTIYTKESLEILAGDWSMQVHHFNEGLHLAFKTQPAWLV